MARVRRARRRRVRNALRCASSARLRGRAADARRRARAPRTSRKRSFSKCGTLPISFAAGTLPLGSFASRAIARSTCCADVPCATRPSFPKPFPRSESMEEVAFARIDAERVRSALAALPPEQREPIELGFFGGMTHEEIARRFHTPLGTIKTRIRSGLRKLRAVARRCGDGMNEHREPPHEMLDDVAVYALGALPPADARRVRDHIRAACALRARVRELKAAAALIGVSAETTGDASTCPSTLLKPRIMAKVRREDRARVGRRSVPAAARMPVWPAYLVAAACVVDRDRLLDVERRAHRPAAASATGDSRVLRSVRDTLARALADQRTHALGSPGHAMPSATLQSDGEVVTRGSHAYIAMHDLPQPPRGKVYQAWTLPKGANEDGAVVDVRARRARRRGRRASRPTHERPRRRGQRRAGRRQQAADDQTDPRRSAHVGGCPAAIRIERISPATEQRGARLCRASSLRERPSQLSRALRSLAVDAQRTSSSPIEDDRIAGVAYFGRQLVLASEPQALRGVRRARQAPSRRTHDRRTARDGARVLGSR